MTGHRCRERGKKATAADGHAIFRTASRPDRAAMTAMAIMATSEIPSLSKFKIKSISI